MKSASHSIANDRTAQLSSRLQQMISGEVRFDKGSRALYATDASLYRHVPIGVVVPRTINDVETTLAVCREFDVPVLSRGAGTSLAGQCCNVAVIIDYSKYLNRLIEVDATRQCARVQPGCVLDVLRDAGEKHHLTFGPDPSTHAHNTLGGMLGNNSCGVHSIMAGRTAENVRSMEIITYDGLRMRVGETSEQELNAIIRGGGRRGEIYAGLRKIRDRYAHLIRSRYPDIPRRVSGYNLEQLLPENGFNVARALVGSEGTCVSILEAELQLIQSPPARVLLVIAYEKVSELGDHVSEILDFGPTGLEGLDCVLIQEMKNKGMHPKERRLLPEGGGWLMVEFGADEKDEASAKARRLMENLGRSKDAPAMELFVDTKEQERLWKLREAGLGATTRSPTLGDTHPGWEDSAVKPTEIGRYLRELRDLMHAYGYEAALYGHFGDGCVHCRINFDLGSEKGIQQWRRFMHDAAELVVRFGGSLSGEHGDGQVRAELLPQMYGEELVSVFRDFKALWDPLGKMNPGKLVDAYPMTSNLRNAPERLPLINSEFDYPQDKHNFSAAVNRCVGIGNCRDQHDGVMCPSYRGTMEEKHSTRGRSRLLFEMLRGETLPWGWRSREVHEALDLCLACKGCKRDCPVNVDMATLKAEFMAHYYRRRLRPRSAYSMGLIWWWSRIATWLPAMTNYVLQTPMTAAPVKWLAGIAQQRNMPRYASESFTRWFRRRGAGQGESRETVVLWPDTFNNYFYPDTLKAAVRVLEAAGFRVCIPARALCCSRPLFAEGMLDLARHQLRSILDELEDEVQNGVNVVGLEPSCVASFRDELPRLFPADARAHYLAEHTHLLSEFLVLKNYHPPRLDRRAVVHMHCHQHASLDEDAECRLLDLMGVQFRVLDAGCCGLAGSFGFRKENHQLSLRIGEQHLMPAVREMTEETLLITNGFSCREQILQATGCSSLNIAEVIALALERTAGARSLAPVPGE